MSLFQLHRDNIYMYVHGEILTANLLVWKKKEIAPVEVTMAYTGEMHRSSHSWPWYQMEVDGQLHATTAYLWEISRW